MFGLYGIENVCQYAALFGESCRLMRRTIGVCVLVVATAIFQNLSRFFHFTLRQRQRVHLPLPLRLLRLKFPSFHNPASPALPAKYPPAHTKARTVHSCTSRLSTSTNDGHHEATPVHRAEYPCGFQVHPES